MDNGMVLIMAVSVLFVLCCVICVIVDIAKTIYSQFKGTEYQWHTIKVLKEKREWWKWVLATGVFAVGIYWMLPLSIVGEADFRASRQKPEYTAYYECKYSIEHFGVGEGHIAIQKIGETIIAKTLYTDEGALSLNLYMESDDVKNSRVRGNLGDNCYAEITIKDGPIDVDLVKLNHKNIPLAIDGVPCDYCEKLFPEEYAYTETNEVICPNCLYAGLP